MRPAARIEQRLQALKAAGQWRDPAAAVGGSGTLADQDWPNGGPQAVVDARSNDYLGLGRTRSGGSAVSRETGAATAGEWGAGASRLISGTKPEHLALERQLSEWLRAESCLLFSSGYATNVGVLSALAAPGDTIFSDSLNHASIVDGCRLGRASVVVVPHRDLGALALGLGRAQPGGALWVVTESYFSMDGDTPDLVPLRQLCDEHQAALVVDEAHALGVFGPEGRGLCAAAGVTPDLLVGGMGKALGLHGGFVAGSALFREWFWNRARSFVFSTAPSPLLCGVAMAQLERLRAADAERRQLRRNEQRLEAKLQAEGISLPPGRHGPLFPIIFGAEAATLRAALELRELGVVCQPIRPPTVPSGGSRLRISLRADLSEAAVDAVAEALISVWRRVPRPVEMGGAGCGVDGSGSGMSPGAGRETGHGVGSSSLGGSPGAGRAASGLGDASNSFVVDASGWAAAFEGVEATVAKPGRARAPASGLASVLLGGSAGSAVPPQLLSGQSPRDAARAPSTWAAGGEGAAPLARSAPAQLGAERWLILGTGTDVGKTFVAEALVRLLVGQGRAVAGLKPIETGTPAGGLVSDASRLAGASFHVKQFPTPHPLYAFPDPVAPWLAARRQNQEICLDAIASWTDRAAEGDVPLALVIETAGGVFSPLRRDASNFDLALKLGAATWVLVAPDRLGVLHDVMSALTAMQSLGRSPDWLVLSAPAQADASTGTNAAELRQLGVRPAVISLERGQVEPLMALLEEQVPLTGRDAPSGFS